MQRIRPDGVPLTVVEGGAGSSSPWLDFPSTVIGRSPFDRKQAVRYRFARHDIVKALEAGRRQPIFEAWSAVLGNAPPVPNISKWDERLRFCALRSLADAEACFRGLRRPVGEDDYGFDMVAFVSRPRWFFRYVPSLACVAELAQVPDDLVFITHVKLDHPNEGRYGGHRRDLPPVRGVVTHWGFFEAECVSKCLPIGHQERYRRRMW
jgi:hypothetical protein